MKKKILFYSVGRSDYDRYLPILNEISKNKKNQLAVALNTVHLKKKFGKTYDFMDKKFKFFKPPNSKNNFKKKKDIIYNFSENLNFLTKVFENYKPDILVVLGDRYEMMCAPLCAIQYNIPIVHFYGGSVTKGSIDDYIRNSISKMSKLHFVVNRSYKQRLIELGEKEKKIKVTGLIGFENFLKKNFISKNKLLKILNLNKKEYILLSFHPETKSNINLSFQLKILSNIVKKLDYNFVISYPNADSGNEEIIKLYKILNKNFAKVYLIKNCGQKLFVNLIKHSKFIIGNSSAGIVETSFLKKTSINIGTRQLGKIIPKNVINVNWNEKKILKKIDDIICNNNNMTLNYSDNPYRQKINVQKIVKLISNVNLYN
jgi:UDP-hydrolysing UDP-N-acetyl-D-glucosamine 2-epimerase